MTKGHNVWAKKAKRSYVYGTENWCKIWKKLACAFKNDMRNLANFHRLKNSDLILKSKMAELNQNQYSKFYFTLEINEWHN